MAFPPNGQTRKAGKIGRKGVDKRVEDGYTLIEVKGEEKGKITEEDTEVTYVYQFSKGQGSVDEPVINPPVEEPPHTSVNTSIYALVLLVNVLGISVLLKKREN